MVQEVLDTEMYIVNLTVSRLLTKVLEPGQ